MTREEARCIRVNEFQAEMFAKSESCLFSLLYECFSNSIFDTF